MNKPNPVTVFGLKPARFLALVLTAKAVLIALIVLDKLGVK